MFSFASKSRLSAESPLSAASVSGTFWAYTSSKAPLDAGRLQRRLVALHEAEAVLLLRKPGAAVNAPAESALDSWGLDAIDDFSLVLSDGGRAQLLRLCFFSGRPGQRFLFLGGSSAALARWREALRRAAAVPPTRRALSSVSPLRLAAQCLAISSGAGSSGGTDNGGRCNGSRSVGANAGGGSAAVGGGSGGGGSGGGGSGGGGAGGGGGGSHSRRSPLTRSSSAPAPTDASRTCAPSPPSPRGARSRRTCTRWSCLARAWCGSRRSRRGSTGRWSRRASTFGSPAARCASR
mmetsp:Transcript_9921/g.32572  ORF Transcript_9921/g.32572 Transcript_9921/m.32572 type:complete len:293 (+) Transcript_9921:43-921(+)